MLLPLLHLTNGALAQTNHMQWGRVLPVSDNTGLHCLNCLFSEHGSFSSQPRSSSGVVFALGKGRAKPVAICHLHGPNLPHLYTPSSPASLEQTHGYLSYVLAGSEAKGTQKTAYVTDMVTLLDTMDSGGFKWGRSPTHSSWKLKSNHART